MPTWWLLPFSKYSCKSSVWADRLVTPKMSRGLADIIPFISNVLELYDLFYMIFLIIEISQYLSGSLTLKQSEKIIVASS